MTLADLGHRIAAAWRVLCGRVTAAHPKAWTDGQLHTLEAWFDKFTNSAKEIEMALSPEVTAALAAIKAAIANAVDSATAAANQKAADEATISGLQGQVADLQSQLSACQAADAAKAAEIATLQADLNDLQSQVTALAAQLNPPVVAPPPPPPPAVDASGAGTGDLTP